MIIRYHGHAEFLIETADGTRILFDPFPPQVGFPMHRSKAELVSISHHHFDHEYLDKVDGDYQVIDTAGLHAPLPGIQLKMSPAFHDDAGGSLRGQILCATLMAEGLKVCHLGDLGQDITDQLAQELFAPDVLLIPVGGTYTLDAQRAKEAIAVLRPRVVIPMHYKNEKGGFPQLDSLEPFLQLMLPSQASRQPLLRITREDLSQQPPLVELIIR